MSRCLRYLEENGITLLLMIFLALETQGIFRISGSAKRVEELRQAFEILPVGFDIGEVAQVHDVSTLLKGLLRDQPESLLTGKLFPLFTAAAGMHFITALTSLDIKEDGIKLRAIRTLIFLLPPQNVQVLYVLLDLMFKVAASSNINQMSATNLATCIGPNMLRKDVKAAKDSNRTSGVSPVLLAAAQQAAAARSGPGQRKSSIFSHSSASTENLKIGGSRDSLLTDKDTKSVLATNAKIVSIVEFMIESFNDIWEVSR
jgi:hypothetical protein